MSTALRKIVNPFPGIRSFESEEHHLFFGRELQIDELKERLAKSRFLAVIGSSGCGKSSLVRAGLLPELFSGKIDGNKDAGWLLTLFRPGNNPVHRLASALHETLKTNSPDSNDIPSPDIIEKTLRSSQDGLINLLRNQKQLSNQVIVIDQFEELFRFKQNEQTVYSQEEAAAFVELILTGISQTEVPLYIVLTMRSDFLGDCTEYRGLPEAINEGHYLVPRMTTDERKKAIVGPVTVSGGTITDRLILRLLADVGDDPDQLPILQHALMRTWDYWEKNKIEDQPLDLHHYEAIGTMKEALSLHAEEVYNELPNNRSKEITEKLFKALTDLGVDSRGTRRPTPMGEILTLTDSKEEELNKVIESFRAPGRAFLMPSSKVPLSPETIIDISHESIMRVWVRLREWVEEETKSAQLYLRLSKSAELYQEGKTGLWTNPELELALQWQQQTRPNQTWAMRYDPAFDRAINFLTYSQREFELGIAKKENLQKRELKRARSVAVFLGTASVISLLFLMFSLSLKFKAEASEKKALEKEQVAIQESKKAEEQRKEAVSQKKISEQQQQIAEQQQIIAEEQKEYALEQQKIAVEQKQEAVYQKQKADVAKIVAIKARDEAEVQKNNAVAQKQIADKERVKAETSEKNTQRLRLLAIARSMSIQATKLQTTFQGDLPALLALQAYNFNKINKGPETDPDLYNALAAVADDKIILRGHQDAVRSVAVNNAGIIASTGDDGSVRLWNPPYNQGPKFLKTNKFGKNGFRTLTFNSKGNILAAGGVDGTILIWDLLQPEMIPHILTGHKSIINSIDINNSSDWLVSAASDNSVRIWNLHDLKEDSKLIEQLDSRVIVVKFNPDGKKLALGTESGMLKLFDLSSESSTSQTLKNSGKAVRSIAFSNDGNTLVSGNTAGIITIHNLKNLGKSVDLIGHISWINELAFSPDNKTLASASSDGTVRLWNYHNTTQQPVILSGHDSWVWSISFNQDGSKLISGSADKTVRVWITNQQDLADRICEKVNKNMSREEWNKYIGSDIEYVKTCPTIP